MQNHSQMELLLDKTIDFANKEAFWLIRNDGNWILLIRDVMVFLETGIYYGILIRWEENQY